MQNPFDSNLATNADAPRRSRVCAAFAGLVTVSFFATGGYLLWQIFDAGLPDLQPFEQHDVDIPAMTEMMMGIPLFAWAGLYAVTGLLQAWLTTRRTIGWKSCLLILFVSVVGIAVLYVAWFALAVLPELKLAAEQADL